jgi:hypothetical protein
VRDAAKRERSDFEEQSQLTAEISAALSSRALEDSPIPILVQRSKIAWACGSAGNGEAPERKRVYKRAISRRLCQAMESGREFMDEKDYHRAARSFACATQASPGSVGPGRISPWLMPSPGARKDALCFCIRPCRCGEGIILLMAKF